MSWVVLQDANEPTRCQAKDPNHCPYHGDLTHYPTKAEAEAVIQAEAEVNGNVLVSIHETQFTKKLPETKKLSKYLAEKEPGKWKFGENHLVCTLFQFLYKAAKLDPVELVDEAVDQLKKVIRETINNTFVSNQLDSTLVEPAAEEIANQVKKEFSLSALSPMKWWSALFGVLALETCPDHDEHEGMADIEREVGNPKTYLKCPPLEKS